MDNNVAEPCGGEDSAELIGGVGVHAVNEFFPFLIIACEAVVLVDNDEVSTIFQYFVHSAKTLLNVRLEIDRLEGCDEVETILPERQCRRTPFHYLAASRADGRSIYLATIGHRDRRIVDACYLALRATFQKSCDIGTAAAPHIEDNGISVDI